MTNLQPIPNYRENFIKAIKQEKWDAEQELYLAKQQGQVKLAQSLEGDINLCDLVLQGMEAKNYE